MANHEDMFDWRHNDDVNDELLCIKSHRSSSFHYYKVYQKKHILACSCKAVVHSA